MFEQQNSKPMIPQFSDLTMMIYGEPGSGKTTLGASLPGAFFACTEPGADMATCPVYEIYSWGNDPQLLASLPPLAKGVRMDFQEFVREVWTARQNGKMAGYKTAVIDIVDNLSKMCLNHVCKRKGIDYPPETDFGKTWAEIREEWETWNKRLLQVVNCVYLTHCAEDKLKLKGDDGIDREVKRRVPTFRGNKMAQFLDGVVNVVGFAHKNADGQFVVAFKSHPEMMTKDRTSMFEAGPATLPLHAPSLEKYFTQTAAAKGFDLYSKWGE